MHAGHMLSECCTCCVVIQALGLGSEIVDTCFKGTPSRIGGIGFEQMGKDTLALHALAYQVCEA